MQVFNPCRNVHSCIYDYTILLLSFRRSSRTTSPLGFLASSREPRGGSPEHWLPSNTRKGRSEFRLSNSQFHVRISYTVLRLKKTVHRMLASALPVYAPPMSKLHELEAPFRYLEFDANSHYLRTAKLDEFGLPELHRSLSASAKRVPPVSLQGIPPINRKKLRVHHRCRKPRSDLVVPHAPFDASFPLGLTEPPGHRARGKLGNQNFVLTVIQ